MRRKYLFESRAHAEEAVRTERKRADDAEDALRCVMHEEPCWKGKERLGGGDTAFYTASLYRPCGAAGGIFLLTWNVPSTGQKPNTSVYRLDEFRSKYGLLSENLPVHRLIEQAFTARQQAWDAANEAAGREKVTVGA